MHIEEHRWWSNHLNREMALKIYGHWGKPFIAFPSSRGRYFDYEGMGMIEAVAGFINSPLSYLAGLDDPWYLDLYRRSKIIVCVAGAAEIQGAILAELRQFQQGVQPADDITLVIIKIKTDF